MDVDLAPLVDIVLQTAAAILMVVATWATAKLKKKFDIDIDASKGGILDNAINKGVDYARGFIVGNDGRVNLHVKNLMVGMAINYIKGKVPETLAHFGLDDQSLAEMVEARLNPKIETEPVPDGSTPGVDYPLPPDAS